MRIRTLAIVGFAVSLAAAAAFSQSRIDRSFTVTSQDCSGVRWSEAALKTYPDIATACQSVGQRNGKTYVKFQGTVSRNINRGEQLAVKFKDGGEIKLTPPANTAIYVNYRKTSVRDLARGDKLNFYVAEDQLAANFAADEAPQSEFVAAMPIGASEPAEARSERLASLPATGSTLPLMGLSGVLLLGLAAIVVLRRMRSSR